MKKGLAIALAMICVLGMFGCGKGIKYSDSTVTEVNTYPNTSMVLFDDTITLDLLTLKVTNQNDFRIESGNQFDFWLEELRDGKWQTIDVGERDNTAEALSFYGEQLLQISIASVYGELHSGHYRVVKCFWPETNSDNKFFLATEFDIA